MRADLDDVRRTDLYAWVLPVFPTHAPGLRFRESVGDFGAAAYGLDAPAAWVCACTTPPPLPFRAMTLGSRPYGVVQLRAMPV
ncbi:hypothetical protein ACFU53_33090 [Streptomyces sp. NPDC057474]|uniref:hypothetical protein n=1 Tax=Streptomyces sp. NPDC057474 TaxID=3346144 RepID=UPI003684382C